MIRKEPEMIGSLDLLQMRRLFLSSRPGGGGDGSGLEGLAGGGGGRAGSLRGALGRLGRGGGSRAVSTWKHRFHLAS